MEMCAISHRLLSRQLVNVIRNPRDRDPDSPPDSGLDRSSWVVAGSWHGQWDWMRDPKIHSATWEWDHASPAELWKHSHNELRHTFTNVLGRDNDLGYGIMRVDEDRGCPATSSNRCGTRSMRSCSGTGSPPTSWRSAGSSAAERPGRHFSPRARKSWGRSAGKGCAITSSIPCCQGRPLKPRLPPT